MITGKVNPAKAPVIKLNDVMTDLVIVSDGVGSNGSPFESVITRTTCGSHIITGFQGEMEIVIVWCPLHGGKTDVVMVMAEVMNPILTHHEETRDTEATINEVLKMWFEVGAADYRYESLNTTTTKR